MQKKNKQVSSKLASSSPLVYSTDPGFKSVQDEPETPTLPMDQQLLRVILETKHRAGKIVTIVYGFEGSLEHLTQLGKDLKNYCGAGGAIKHHEIIIQGDHRQKIFQYLRQKGFTKTKL